jgi:PhoPQ-activated pathogenicity-related protein
LEAFAAERTGEKDLGFFVFGGSKRGWTTWLAAAADTRVKAIAPLVYDNLDLASQMKHHVTAWGDYSYKIKDYTKLDLPAMLSTDKGKDLIQLVDPYAYLDTITIPKLIVMGTNDPYWPLDALNIYYSDLKGSNYIYYVPNAGHDLGKRYDAVIRPITALYLSTTGLVNMPDLTWKANETGEGLEIRINGQPAPFKVDFWVAHSATRDFRPAKWESFQGSSEAGEFIYKLPRPKDGWSAIYAEAHYQLLGKTFSLCSQVFLISK